MPTMVALSAKPTQLHELRLRGLPIASSAGADNHPPCNSRGRTGIPD
jgi:hypothetical protein